MQARRFVHVVGLIAWHEREDFLSSSQVNGLFDTASAILRIQGIPEETSKMSFLHGELRLLRSQLRRKEGRSIESIWDALLARSVSGRSPLEEGRAALAIALRLMRRGETRLAMSAFAEAETQAKDRGTRERACLGRIQLLRLAGKLSESEHYASLLLAEGELSLEASLELEWERICRQTRESGEVLPLVLASSRGGSHRHASYVIESTIWVKVCAAKTVLTRVPKVESIRRSFPDNIRRGAPLGRFYEVALRLDRCYDTEIPRMFRLDELGWVLAEATRLPTLDKELLAWAAAARWLSRNKQPKKLEFVLAEYRALSLRVTMGGGDDALGLLSDLIKSHSGGGKWFKETTSIEEHTERCRSLPPAREGAKFRRDVKMIVDPNVCEIMRQSYSHRTEKTGALLGCAKLRACVGSEIPIASPIRLLRVDLGNIVRILFPAFVKFSETLALKARRRWGNRSDVAKVKNHKVLGLCPVSKLEWSKF